MLSLLAAAQDAPLYWADLGLTRGIDLGFFTLRWYSLAYLAGIVLGYWHLSRMIKAPGAPMAQRHADDLFFWCTLGIILGGRLGYATFYTGGETGIPSLWSQPGELLKLWNGGMSFHGGLIGTVLAMAWVSWRGKLSFLRVADYVAVCVPFGMLFGRLANFVNGELWGRVATGVPWAMIFPDGGPLPRHPSQLYEAGLEGLLLGALLLWLAFRADSAFRRPGLISGTFFAGYGIARFLVEFFRQPDAQFVTADNPLGLYLHLGGYGLTAGQILSLPMVLVGVWFVMRARRDPA